MANALLDGQVIGFNPMVADTPPQYAGPAKPAQSNWFLDALGRDANRLMGTISDGVLAPINALTGQYNYVQVDPATGAVQPVNSGMMQAAGDMSSLINLGAPGMVPAEALGMGIKAYHGTPHSFDKFDISKIGTGEGAQAYGHGLYFAESPDVARAYRDALSNGKAVTFDIPEYGQVKFTEANGHFYDQDGNSIEDWFPGGNAAAKAASTFSSSLGWKQYLRRANIDPDEAVKAIKVLRGNKAEAASPGELYEVDIDADPATFLDWDKPLSAQTPEMQAALSKVFGVPVDKMHDQMFLHGISEKQAAALHEQGVSGVRYLDQSSRNAGNGTSNYVVFSDDPISITGRVPAAAGGVGGPITHTPADPSHPVLMELRS